jgi:hypothetical protein
MFFKVENDTVVRVMNKANLSVITMSEVPYMVEDALDESFPSTESEFNEAYKIAFERIKEMKI